jgi:hypothetical protein
MKVKDPETDEVKEIEVEAEDPELLAVDKVAYQDSIKFGLPYCPTRIRIDERFCPYNIAGGELYNMLFPLEQAQKTSNSELWNRGKITVWDILENIGLESKDNPTIDRDMAEKFGIVDVPEVYDMQTRRKIKVPGFNEDPFASKYPDTSSHKCVSFGPAVDAMIEDTAGYELYVNKVDNDYFLMDEEENKQYLYIDINADGIITTWKIGCQPKERKISAWHQHPETQK